MHPASNRPALHQGVIFERLQCGEVSLSLLPESVDLHRSVPLLKYGKVNHFVFEFVDSVNHGMIYFFNRALLKLHTQGPVCFWVTCNSQHP